MNRRDTLLALLAFGAVPVAARAQQPAKPARIAWLGLGSAEANGYQLTAFKQGMSELGYAEDKNYVLDIRWASGKAEQLPQLAQELVTLQPKVILVGASSATRAAQQTTTAIPIVMAAVAEPIANGFIKSHTRPGGNITGLSILTTDVSPKMLQLLRLAVPKLARVAVLWNPSVSTGAEMLKNIQTAAQRVGVEIHPAQVRTPAEIEAAFADISRSRPEAVMVVSDAFLLLQRRQIADLALKHRIPSIFAFRESVEAGGLMSYGTDIANRYRRSAIYVDKILKGAKPGDLPVEQPTNFELVINRNTAKALGLTLPAELLVRADKVIE